MSTFLVCVTAHAFGKKKQTKVITIRNYGSLPEKIVYFVYSPDKGPQLKYDLKKYVMFPIDFIC